VTEENYLDSLDEPVIEYLKQEFLIKNKTLPTHIKLRAGLNILVSQFRLCCVCCDRKDLEDVAKKIYEGRLSEIDEEMNASESD